MSRWQEKRLLSETERQPESSQAPWRKSLRRKAICLNKFLMKTKAPYSGKNCYKWYVLVKKRRDHQDLRQALLLCANAVRRMISTALVYKAEPWRKKDKHQLPVGCTRKWPGQHELFFWIGSIDAFSLKLGSTLPVRYCLLTVLFILDSAPGHPECHEINTKGVVKVVYLPQMECL